MYMGKKSVSLMATVGMVGGGYVPALFSDNSFLDIWGILGGIVGGIVGIWLGFILVRRFS